MRKSLENERLLIEVADRGSELVRIYDKKNKREDAVYVSSLNTFGWISDTIDKDNLINCNLKLLTKCDELYILPNYELDEVANNCIGVAKLLGLPITYL